MIVFQEQPLHATNGKRLSDARPRQLAGSATGDPTHSVGFITICWIKTCESKEDLEQVGLVSPFYIARRYRPLRGLSSSSCRGPRPSAETSFALWVKKSFLYCFSSFLVFSSNLSNLAVVTFSFLKKNLKKFKQSKKTQKKK